MVRMLKYRLVFQAAVSFSFASIDMLLGVIILGVFRSHYSLGCFYI